MNRIALLMMLMLVSACPHSAPSRSGSEDPAQSSETDAGPLTSADAGARDSSASAGDAEVSSDGGPATSIDRRVREKLVGCKVLDLDKPGSENLGLVWDEYDLCKAECFLDAECTDLQAVFCEPGGSEAVRGCIASCPLHPEHGFVCSDGTKIPQAFACDLTPNCAAGEEEGVQCGQFGCDDGQILQTEGIHCNGVRECRDGSDELRCSFQCGESKAVICGDGRKVPEVYVCDGEDDCDDGADERGCPPNFECDFGGTSLHPSLVCDGESDCFDGTDERGCA